MWLGTVFEARHTPRNIQPTRKVSFFRLQTFSSHMVASRHSHRPCHIIGYRRLATDMAKYQFKYSIVEGRRHLAKNRREIMEHRSVFTVARWRIAKRVHHGYPWVCCSYAARCFGVAPHHHDDFSVDCRSSAAPQALSDVSLQSIVDSPHEQQQSRTQRPV